MIEDLQNIVTLYLDPISYIKLQCYNPKKYNKLGEIKKAYKCCIVDSIRKLIIASAIVLKTEVVNAYSENIESKELAHKKATNLIIEWSKSTIEYILTQYDSINLNPFAFIEFYLHEKKNPRIAYSLRNEEIGEVNHILESKISKYNDEDKDKDMMLLGSYLFKVCKYIAEKKFNKAKAEIALIPEYFETASQIKVTLSQNFHKFLEMDFANDKYKNSEDKIEQGIYYLYHNMYLSNLHKSLEFEHIKEYWNTKMFAFNSDVLKLVDDNTNLTDHMSPTLLQSLNDVFETIDQFIRILYSYNNIIF